MRHLQQPAISYFSTITVNTIIACGSNRKGVFKEQNLQIWGKEEIWIFWVSIENQGGKLVGGRLRCEQGGTGWAPLCDIESNFSGLHGCHVISSAHTTHTHTHTNKALHAPPFPMYKPKLFLQSISEIRPVSWCRRTAIIQFPPPLTPTSLLRSPLTDSRHFSCISVTD